MKRSTRRARLYCLKLSTQTKTVGYDFPVLRYADVLLMYAESLNEIKYDKGTDSDSPAFKALNEVRNRAKATLYTSTQLTDQSSFKDAVLLEGVWHFRWRCNAGLI